MSTTARTPLDANSPDNRDVLIRALRLHYIARRNEARRMLDAGEPNLDDIQRDEMGLNATLGHLGTSLSEVMRGHARMTLPDFIDSMAPVSVFLAIDDLAEARASGRVMRGDEIAAAFEDRAVQHSQWLLSHFHI